MTRSDAWIGLILVGVAAAALSLAWSFPSVPGMRFGAWTFPIIISVGLGLCGFFLTVKSLLLERSERAQGIQSGPIAWQGHEVQSLLGFALVAIAPAFYIAAAETIGFLICTGAIMFVLSWWFWRGFVRCTTLSASVALAAELVFAEVFAVPLPEGWISVTELL